MFGGTFDPPHYGHLRSVEEIWEQLRLDKVLFVPVGVPPHKQRPVTEFHVRHELTRLAVEGLPHFECTDIEHRRPGASYTLDTLVRLQSEYSVTGAALYLIMGADSFLEITTWKSYESLPQLAHFVVLNRPGFDNGGLEKHLRSTYPGYEPDAQEGTFRHAELLPIHFVRTTLMDISSTDIRKRVREGRSIRFLVPETVRAATLKKGLYRS